MLLFQYFFPIVGLAGIDEVNAAASINTDKSEYSRGDQVSVTTGGLSGNKYYKIRIKNANNSTTDITSCIRGNKTVAGKYNISDSDPLGSWSAELRQCGFFGDSTVATAPFTVSETTVPPVPNPTLPNSCGVDMALVIDNSTSISSSELAQMKTAMIAFVNAFAGTPTQFSVTSFATTATIRQGFTGNTAAVISAINSIPVGGGYTNWEDGLIKAQSTYDPRVNPNLMVFSSDGNPNRVDDGTSATEAQAVAEAVLVANAIKTGGTRILALGIGDNLKVANLQAISGPNVNTGITSDVITSNFSQLADDLAYLASLLCGGTITVSKFINDLNTPAGTGWNFDVAGQAVSTDSYGQTPAVDVDPGTYNVIEPSVNPGHIFGSAGCKYQDGSQAGTPSTTFDGVENIDVDHTDIVSCSFINIEKGEILGVKWNDLDGDGVKDGGEPTLSGWDINILDATGAPYDSIITDSDGEYSFTGLDPSDYTVCEVMKDGWERTYPAGSNCQNVSVGAGQVVPGVNFGNRGALSISGTKYEYMVGPLNGWEINLTGTTDYGRSVDMTMDTAGSGEYLFDHLEPGNYVVSEEDRAGWVHLDGDSVPVNLVNVDEYVDFTNFECATLSGFKWEDMNGDGLPNGEPALQGVQIEINGPESSNDSDNTDENGYYEFEVCIPGTYVVTEVLDPGWYNVYPVNHQHSRDVVSGSNYPELNFGNARYGMIFGMKFGDLNGNGIQDGVETGLGGWDIELQDEFGNVLATTTTAGDGSYSFEYNSVNPVNLLAGELYFLREKIEDQPGWIQTYGPSSPFSMESGDVYGDDIEEVSDFGNFENVDVTVCKYEDMNGDGVIDGDGLLMDPWGISLNGSDYVYTSDGCVTFSDIGPGSYVLSEESKSGWVQTYPGSGIHEFDTISGNNPTFDFGNYQHASITVNKNVFASDMEDISDNSLFEVTVSDLGSLPLAENNSAVYSDIAPGEYTISETSIPPGYLFLNMDVQDENQDKDGIQVVLTSGENIIVNIFNKQKKSKISIRKMVDQDGILCSSDDRNPYTTGWDVRLITDDVPGDWVQTNSEGRYTWEELPSTHTYGVEEFILDGWVALNPQLHNFGNLTPGTNNTYDFVNFKPGKVSGYKFDDINGDGKKDPDELVLQGWEICLEDLRSGKSDCKITDIFGYYEFTGLPVGNYMLYETLQGGWDQTVAPAIFEITESGQVLENQNFGNRFIISDLQIEKVDDEVEPFNPGDRVTYTLTVTNNGPYPADNVVVTDTLPDDVTFAYTSATHGACDEVDGVVTCNLGTLDVDEEATIIIGADISLLFTGELENLSVVASDTPDDDDSNNDDDEFTQVEEEGEILGVSIEAVKPEPEVLGATGSSIKTIMTIALVTLMLSIAVYLNTQRNKK